MTEDPRSEHARVAALHAVDDLLVEVGYAALTMKGIAERAGVGRQTVYRWWSSQRPGAVRGNMRAHRQHPSSILTGPAYFQALVGQPGRAIASRDLAVALPPHCVNCIAGVGSSGEPLIEPAWSRHDVGARTVDSEHCLTDALSHRSIGRAGNRILCETFALTDGWV